MKKTKTVIRGIAIALIVVFCMSIMVPVQASQKAVSEKKITISLDKKTPRRYCWIKAKDSDSSIVLSVKIKKLKGKATEKTIPYLHALDYENGKGSLCYNLKSSKFKKGAVLPLSESEIIGDGRIGFEMPKGVKSVTYEVTVKGKNNKKTIIDVITTKENEPEGFNFGQHGK